VCGRRAGSCCYLRRVISLELIFSLYLLRTTKIKSHEKNALSLYFIFAIGASAKAQDSLAQYTGKFSFPEGSIVTYVTVTAEAGKLNLVQTKGLELWKELL